MRVEKAMIPNPPSWNKIRITTCPKGVKQAAVSWTIKPVTQTADVLVKRASTNDMFSPEWVLNGRSNKAVPIKMAAIKLRASSWAG